MMALRDDREINACLLLHQGDQRVWRQNIKAYGGEERPAVAVAVADGRMILKQLPIIISKHHAFVGRQI